MSESLLYRSGGAYSLVMRALYGRHYDARYRAVAALIPPGAEVLDVCSGPGTLYRRYLRDKHVRYRGLDINPRFVGRVRSLGAAADEWDLSEDKPLPAADLVLIQGSLYHFLPTPGPVVERMLRAARRSVAIAEPVRNLSSSRLAPVSRMGRKLTRVGGAGSERFDERSLDGFMDRYAAITVERFLIPGGRDKVYLLDATRAEARVSAGGRDAGASG